MPGLHLDNCVAKQVARLLTQAGYSVVTAAELGLQRAPDGRQLLEAAQQGRVFISHNADHFTSLHDAWHLWSRRWGVSAVHADILLSPHALPHVEVRHIAENMASGCPLTNELYRWRPRGGRVRHPTPLLW